MSTEHPRLTRADVERIRTEAVVYGCSHTNVTALADTALDAMRERDEANLAAHANNGKAILAEQDLRAAEARIRELEQIVPCGQSEYDRRVQARIAALEGAVKHMPYHDGGCGTCDKIPLLFKPAREKDRE